MPINRDSYEHLARELRDAAERAQFRIFDALRSAAEAFARGGNVIAIQRAFDRAARRAIREWEAEINKWLRSDLPESYRQGIEQADRELRAIEAGVRDGRIPSAQPFSPSGQLAEQLPEPILRMFSRYPEHRTLYSTFHAAARDQLQGTALPVLRASNDIFRQLAIEAGLQEYAEANVFTRRQLSQNILNRAADNGITAIRYADGRNVSIQAYAEMVGRTMTGNASRQAFLNRTAEMGYELVRMSQHTRPSPWCEPYQGRVLDQSGTNPRYPSLSQAIADGAFHPACRHWLAPFIPGVSQPLDDMVHPHEREVYREAGRKRGDELMYEAEQRQRAIERNIRHWKRREAVALAPDTREYTSRKVREWQSNMRDHLKDNRYLPRKRTREQVRKAV